MPKRAVLEGIDRITYEPHDKRVELTPFPSAMKACLKFLGETWSYEYLMGMSGAAFRLLWNPGQWDPANADTLVMDPDPLDPHRRTFAAVGRSFESLVVGPDVPEAEVRRRITASIDAGVPVIGFGVVGPPEACIIAGYDEGGEVLIGWSYFQGMPDYHPSMQFEPSGYFRKRGWLEHSWGFLFIGPKGEMQPVGDLRRKALARAVDMARREKVGPRVSGLAAYTAWASDLVRDDQFPAGDLNVLTERWMAHNDAMQCVAEGRWQAGVFLKQISVWDTSLSRPMDAAASCLKAEQELIWDGWNLVGGPAWSEEQIHKLAQAGVRLRLHGLIMQAKHKHAEAIRHIEQALEQ